MTGIAMTSGRWRAVFREAKRQPMEVVAIRDHLDPDDDGRVTDVLCEDGCWYDVAADVIRLERGV
jgi:phosphoketolase